MGARREFGGTVQIGLKLGFGFGIKVLVLWGVFVSECVCVILGYSGQGGLTRFRFLSGTGQNMAVGVESIMVRGWRVLGGVWLFRGETVK